LTKHIFHPRHRFYCSFTPALFCLRKKARNKLGFTFGRCFRFEISKLRRTPWKQDTTATASRGGGRDGEKLHIDTQRAGAAEGDVEEEGGGRVGAGVFFLKTSLAPRVSPSFACEKNGKTIFCRFAPSSPLSLSLSFSLCSLLPFSPFPFLSFPPLFLSFYYCIT